MARVTLGEIAKAAGVSRATASRALHNNPLIASETRQRIQKIAERLGYRPDPEASRLLSYLKRSRQPPFQSTIAILNAYTPPALLRDDPYTVNLLEGACARAALLGYTTDEINLGTEGMTPARLDGILQARGIRGLLIPPEPNPLFEVGLDWTAVAAVATTTTAAPMQLHRVLPNNFANMVLLVDLALARGYKRIGLISWSALEIRQMMAPTSVYARMAYIEKRFVPVPIFQWDFTTGEENCDQVGKWFLDHRPDLVLGMNDLALDAIEASTGLCAPQDFGFIAYAFHVRSDLTRLDEKPQMVGTAAIDLLSTHIHHNETGIPATPMTLLVEGEVIRGRTTV